MDLNGATTHDEITVTQKPNTPDDDFDDELGFPNTLTIISVEGTPVVVEHDDLDIGNAPSSDKIPFGAVHKRSVKFKSYNRNVFIPGVDVHVTITDNERNLTTHFLNPNLYTISLTHGNFMWQIKKRYKHIHHLHQQLVIFRTSLNIPFPTKTHRERRDTFKNNAVRSKPGKRKGSLPRFPKKPEVLIPFEQLPSRIKQLEDYLNNLLSLSIYRNHPETVS
ncbi:hypothetical protein ILUMI_08826 [Ignelater luminosus]|uniref:PX domain-containing protein n=1 Tax=Ignelater luminosus TaxID=2038154 RepID=A0A8K0D0Y5_IGNLU|nr:hypothetical protein ILUMI_08826 [Ignelater luminosus]